jgi:hypothetical protein
MQNFDNLCKALNQLANVQKDQKLYFSSEIEKNPTNQKVDIQDPSWTTSFSRTFTLFKYSTCESTFKYVENLYYIGDHSTRAMLNNMQRNRILHLPNEPGRRQMTDIEYKLWYEERSLYETLLKYARDGLNGLRNLEQTYPKNENFKFLEDKMEKILQKHEEFLNDIDRYMKSIIVLTKSTMNMNEQHNQNLLSSTSNNNNNNGNNNISPTAPSFFNTNTTHNNSNGNINSSSLLGSQNDDNGNHNNNNIKKRPYVPLSSSSSITATTTTASSSQISNPSTNTNYLNKHY